MQFDLSRASQNGGFDVRITLVDRSYSKVDCRFSQHGDFECASKQMSRRNFLPKPLTHLALKQRLHLMWRPRQQNDNALPPFELAAEPLARGRAIRVWENRGSFENVPLLSVVFRHLPSALGEPLLELCNNFRITPQSYSQGFGNGFPGQIVFGGSESATEDDDVRAKKRMLSRGYQMAHVVADYALEYDINSQQVELLGQV